MTWKRIALLCLLVALIRWQTWSLPLNRDEGAYAYIATYLSQPGFMPYRDAFDHKPPGVYFLYHLAFQFFGPSEFSIRFLSYGNAVLSALVIYAILRLLGITQKNSWLFTLVYSLISNSFILEGQLANTEMFMTTFLIISLLLTILYLKSSARSSLTIILAGIFASFSMLLKPVAITNILVIYLIIIFRLKSKSLLTLIKYTFGLFFPLVSIIYWLISGGAFSHFLSTVMGFNWYYISDGLVQVSQKINPIVWLFRGHPMIQIFLISWLLGVFISLKYRLKSMSVFLLWFFAYYVGAKLTARNVLHYYFPLIQAWVILFALFWHFGYFKKVTFIAFSLFTILWGWIIILPPRAAYARTFGSTANLAYLGRDLGQQLSTSTSPTNEIFLWVDEPEILFYSHRKSTTRHINTFALPIPGAEAELISGLDKSPAVIITYPGSPPVWLEKYFTENSYKLTLSNALAKVYRRL